MNKITRIRLIFLAIFLISGITLSLIYASTALTLNDTASESKNQLSKATSKIIIKNHSDNHSNSPQLSDILTGDYANKSTVIPTGQNDVQTNVISRGLVSRRTYDKGDVVEKPAKLSEESPTSPEVNNEVNKLESSEAPQEEVVNIQASQSTQETENLQYANDLDLLARLITAEAQGEPYEAKVAVGAVVINRVNSGLWASTIKDVIYQNINGYYQFTPVVNGWIDKPAQPESIQAAEAAMNGADPTGGAQFYYDNKTTNTWILSKPVSLQIGHMVYAY